MAYAMQAAPKPGSISSSSTGPNPISGAIMEGPILEYPGIQLVRRPLSRPSAVRPDDRRTGPALQRQIPGKESEADRHPDGGLDARACGLTRPACPGSSPRRTCRRSTRPIVYPGQVFFEGTNVSEGPGDDAALRVLRRALDRRLRAGEKAQRPRAPRRHLPGAMVHADVLQIQGRAVRRLPDPRHGPERLPASAKRRSTSSRPSATMYPGQFQFHADIFRQDHGDGHGPEGHRSGEKRRRDRRRAGRTDWPVFRDSASRIFFIESDKAASRIKPILKSDPAFRLQ